MRESAMVTNEVWDVYESRRRCLLIYQTSQLETA